MTKPDENEDASEEALNLFAPYLMNRSMHRYNQGLQAEIAPMGLSVSKVRALAALATRGKLTVNELSVYAVAEQSTMSRTVDQMEKDGLIRRTVSAEDSRVRLVSLSDAGRVAYHATWPKMLAAQGVLLEGLNEATRLQFVETLNQILHNVRVNDF